MKVLVTYGANTIVDVYYDKQSIPVGCYVIDVDDIDDKLVPKGYWRDLKNNKNNPIWDTDESILKPLKGFVIADNVKVKFKSNPRLWTVEEVLKEKYDKKLKKHGVKNVFYQEFIAFDKIVFEGDINFGKKFCNGYGTLIHSFEQSSKEFIVDTEFLGEQPKMFVCSDKQSWVMIDSKSFLYKSKKETSKIYVSIESKNVLNAYSIYF